MSSSEDEFPCVRATIVRDLKAEAKAKEVKADAEARAKAIAEFVADEEDADFTQHYRENSICNSKRLSAMATKSSGDRVRATAYLGVGMKAAEKRKKKLKKVESAKKQKQKDSKKLQKVVESLFAMRCPAMKSPTSTSTPIQECRRDFDPVSIQAFASTSPKGTTPTNRSSVNVTTPSTVSSIATTSITNDTNFICRGCGNTASLCHEVKYRNFCLHAVMDYFELVGMDFSTQHGITNAFTLLLILLLSRKIYLKDTNSMNVIGKWSFQIALKEVPCKMRFIFDHLVDFSNFFWTRESMISQVISRI